MASHDLKLLGAKPSPFVHRVKLALKLKSIPYEYIDQNLGSKSELLLKSNPVYKKVPVLLHNDKPICESLLILQYIDEVWPNNGPSLLPSDPYDLAIVRFWASYFDDKWLPIFWELRSAEGAELESAVARAAEGLVILEDAFGKISKGKPYFGGNNIGYLDIAIGCLVGWIKAREIVREVKFFDETRTPALFEWAEKFTSNDVVKDVVPTTDDVVETIHMFRKRAKYSISKRDLER